MFYLGPRTNLCLNNQTVLEEADVNTESWVDNLLDIIELLPFYITAPVAWLKDRKIIFHVENIEESLYY